MLTNSIPSCTFIPSMGRRTSNERPCIGCRIHRNIRFHLHRCGSCGNRFGRRGRRGLCPWVGHLRLCCRLRSHLRRPHQPGGDHWFVDQQTDWDCRSHWVYHCTVVGGYCRGPGPALFGRGLWRCGGQFLWGHAAGPRNQPHSRVGYRNDIDLLPG